MKNLENDTWPILQEKIKEYTTVYNVLIILKQINHIMMYKNGAMIEDIQKNF